MTGEFPAQRASNAENISIWWRHHDGRRDLEKSCQFECYTRPCDYHVSLHQNNYGAQYTPPLALSIIATCLKCKPLSVFWVASSIENISTDWACTPFRPWTLFGLNTLHSKNYKHGFGVAMFCCDLLQVNFTHFLQGWLTGTEAVMWLSQCQLRVGSPEEYGKMKNMNTLWLPHYGKNNHIMTSSNGIIFRVGPLCGEFTGHRWIPLTKASDAEALVFSLICAWIKGWVNNRETCDLRRHRVPYNVTVMYILTQRSAGDGSMSSGNKPLPEPVLTQVCTVIWHQMLSNCWINVDPVLCHHDITAPQLKLINRWVPKKVDYDLHDAYFLAIYTRQKQLCYAFVYAALYKLHYM